VKMSMLFCVVTLCGDTVSCPHGVTTQNNNIDLSTTRPHVRTECENTNF
jgi:hypothetical protein